MSYRQARRSKLAEQHFKQREAEHLAEKANRDVARLNRSRAWLEEYHAPQQPKETPDVEAES